MVNEIIEKQVEEGTIQGIDAETAIENFNKAIAKGIVKVMNKIGISTLHSYRGAQIFEALGLSEKFVDQFFCDTATRIEGAGLYELEREIARRYSKAFSKEGLAGLDLEIGGEYRWRRDGEAHMLNPTTIAKLQQAVKQNKWESYEVYSKMINEQSEKLMTIRGLFEFASYDPIPLDEVEPWTEIVKRFKTGAMSLGSISAEAHENLAIAMNRIGGKSNSGEGGEDPQRFQPDNNGNWRNSAIKQVASGRFGVSSHYLSSAKEIQIKMAQGAKPGEGGQLPGPKVNPYIASVRNSTPYVGLISPPPHHDIYSIEDLAQLIYDLKNANREARVNVKLVSEVGVGTIAAGVAKAKADVILISGFDGGTGASPLTSLKHAGLPWELGIAEAQQTLVMNDLRNRIVLECDGQMKTGRDVAIACLLGAEEFGFSTAPLVASGCIMMRACHLNTCPVGIATQDPELRKNFKGKPEHVINFMYFVAEELRQIMADLGFRTVDEMVGQSQKINMKKAVDHFKAQGIDLSKILYKPEVGPKVKLYNTEKQDHGLDNVLDFDIISAAHPAIYRKEEQHLEFDIRNTDRTVGAILSNEISKIHGANGLPQHTLSLKFTGTAGQSFGAFGAKGLFMKVDGTCNDYFGKGLSGGTLVAKVPETATFKADENIIVGNVALYGAVTGEAYINGIAGERFCVRNSGATAVVEGIGDHGCEYMTGGIAVILGETGRNFAAGMSGGIAYLYSPDGTFDEKKFNLEMVELEDLTDQDRETVHGLLVNHKDYTSSSKAASILKDWPESAKNFIKVMPTDYKKALALLAAEKNKNKTLNVMGKLRGFMEYDRINEEAIDPKKRIENYKEFTLAPKTDQLQEQGGRCMDCGVPFCHSGCPLGNLIPDFNDAVYKNDWQKALTILHSTNNFPEFTGRLCPAPCEEACVLGIVNPPVSIELIEKYIVERGYAEGWIKAQPPVQRTGKTVAVVGSGPAGLAAAQQLNRAGHKVTVYERDNKIGGLLRYGIPDFKMEKNVIDRRLAILEEEGIEFIVNTEIGKDIQAEQLEADYDAVVLCMGATVRRELPIPGADLKGVEQAMDFLPHNNKAVDGQLEREEKYLATDKNVVVIGGGDTGSDCIGTSNRHGAKSVTNFEIMPNQPTDVQMKTLGLTGHSNLKNVFFTRRRKSS